MKKKIAALICLLVCVFSLTACTDGVTTPASQEIDSSMSEWVENLVTKLASMEDEALASNIEYYGIDGESPNAGLLSGLESWESTKEELGAYVSFDSCETTYDEDDKQYTTSAMVTYESHPCEVRIISNRQLEISTISFNVQYTFGERMARAGMNTLMGMGTVFLMLILICLIIYCFGFIHKFEEKAAARKAAEKAAQTPVSEPIVATALQQEEEEELTDDLELVAVITAAIAAAEETESADGLVVRSIRRVGTNKWKRA